jgi:hypothetical protein
MKVPLPLLSEILIGPKYFSREAHAPHPSKLIQRVREKAPEFVKMPSGNEEFDFDLCVQLKFAAMGDWLVLYQALYDLSEKYEYIRLLADIAQEVLLLCHTPIETLDDYILTYDRDKFNSIAQYLPAVSINIMDNPFSNRAFPDPKDANKFYPKLSKMNKMDFKVMQFKLKRGDFANLQGQTGDIDMETFSNIENQIKFAKSERVRIQNLIQQLLSQQQSISEKIQSITSQRANLARHYENQEQQYQIQKVALPTQSNEISILQNQITSIGDVQREVLSSVGWIKDQLRIRKDHWNFVYDDKGNQKWYVDEKERAKRRTWISDIDNNIAAKKGEIAKKLIDVGVSVSDLPENPDDMSTAINVACSSKIQQLNDQIQSKKAVYDDETKKANDTNRELDQKISQIITEKNFELGKLDSELSNLNKQLTELQTQLKIKDDLIKLNSEINQLQQKFNQLQAGYDVQTQIDAQKELDAKKREEIQNEIENAKKTWQQRYSELKNKTESRHTAALKKIEEFESQIESNHELRKSSSKEDISQLQLDMQREQQRIRSQLQQDQDIVKRKELELELKEIEKKYAKKIAVIEAKVAKQKEDELAELERMKNIEKEQWENDLWDLKYLEFEPTRLSAKLKEFNEQAELRIKNIQMESGLETPITLTPSVLLTRILRNIEYYYARIYDELPLLFKDANVVPRIPQRFLFEPVLFLNYHYSLVSFKDKEEASTYISDVIIPPGASREYIVTTTTSKKTEKEVTNSILESIDEKTLESLQKTFQKQQQLKKVNQRDTEDFNKSRLGIGSDIKAHIEAPGQSLDATINVKYDNERTQKTVNKNTKDEQVNELQNTVSSHNQEVNQKRQKEVVEKTKTEYAETVETKEIIKLTNENLEQAIKIKFYQATQIHDCYIVIDDIDLEFTNGFESKIIPIRELENLPLNYGETGQEAVFLEGIKRYIYIAGDFRSYLGEFYHFFTPELVREPANVWRLPTKNEDFYGVPVRYFQEHVLLDSITKKMELDTTILADSKRKRINEARTQIEEAKSETAKFQAKVLQEKVKMAEHKNRIMNAIASAIERADAANELTIEQIESIGISLLSEGIEYLQKPFTLDYLANKKPRSNLLLLDRDESDKKED